jgi:regulator of protease activity HflC (stomatin/prohibitin superfamily)
MSVFWTGTFFTTSLICLISYFIGVKDMFLIALSSAILWTTFYVYRGWTEVPVQDFMVIERFGLFVRVLLPGPHILCFPWFIDKQKNLPNTLKKESLEFFKRSGTNNLIDFADGYSAPTTMTAWYLIENPILWAYRVDDPTTWLEDHIFRTVQHKLEALTLKEASTSKVSIAQSTLDADLTIGTITKRLKLQVEEQLGIDLTSFIIDDIDIPDVVKEIRMEEQRGIANANKRVAIARGYEEAIQAIITIAKTVYKRDMPYAEAKRLYDENQNREVASGSNFTIIGGDIQKSLASIFGGRET